MPSKAKTLSQSSMAIVFHNVTKRFGLYQKKLHRWPFWQTQHFRALSRVSFAIRRGETVGLLGPNGSGKTVILKLIAGITKPDEGQIRITGKVTPILALGAGLHEELSGYDNIFLYGMLLGIPKSFLQQNLYNIANFAGIGRFLKLPVKKYSTGMKARLSFAIATSKPGDILLIDEVLSVGDQNFQIKARERLLQLKKHATIVITSHSPVTLRSLCSRIIQMSKINRAIRHHPPRTKLLRQLISQKSIQLTVASSSMEPTISRGDRVEIRYYPSNQLKVGDIILFSQPYFSALALHRIKAVLHQDKKVIGFLTQGDRVQIFDPFLVQPKNYIGKVTKIISSPRNLPADK